MEPLYLAVGIVVLVAVIVDILWTTLWVDGGSGPLSGRLTTWTWRGLRTLSGDHPRALSLAGPLILAFTLAMWIALLWIGWTFLFAGDKTALISPQTGEYADWTGRFYYVAYTMFTNGNGDYSPTTGTWEIASSFTTATGMAFVTLGVSYILTVLGAVSEKRSFASDVTGLGERSEAFVRAGWNGTDEEFRGLDLPMESLSTQLSLLADQHKAYPILHYYHSEQPSRASAMAVPIFDEALTLFRHGVDEDAQPNPTLVENARASVDSYLDTLETAFIEPADEVPPPPDLERVRDEEIPTADDDELDEALEELSERRRKLLGVVRADAWYWPSLDE
ncbi:two pore domain potassium channel family protein [Natronorubrum sp. JWXQ-INN-674]|uniref:Two pore domain potassium channel family protein n=1 Tax=Natronorubrum halalkaliphilum TaxID=2691917 RepID=A0A6B0VQL5_9EURY|nr:potassium channel family protein [Natronorubrum halalkaliphilum]MXV63377.1 two pore domain potassium channel family protein [Natronorubrum halalkaliphilum]